MRLVDELVGSTGNLTRRECLRRLVGVPLTSIALPFLGACSSMGRDSRLNHSARVEQTIGYLSPGPDDPSSPLWSELARYGWVQGENLTVLHYTAAISQSPQSPGSYEDRAATLAKSNVAVILTEGTPATRAVMEATNTIPIVAAAGDLVRAGLAKSLARPGGNVTGVSLFNSETYAKCLELLHQISPGLIRAAVVWDPVIPDVAIEFEAVRKAAQTLGIELHSLTVSGFVGDPSRTLTEMLPALSQISAGGLEGLVVPNAGSYAAVIGLVIESARHRSIPDVYH